MTQTGRLYGGSLYDLAAEEQLTDTILHQMQEVRQIFRENPDYLRLLSEPSIPKKERIGLIEQAFGVQLEKYLLNFFKLLCEKNILHEFSDCCEEFTQRYQTERGIIEAVVTSAVELSEEQVTALKAKLEKVSGKEISIVWKKDPTVLAGLRVEMEGIQYDGTVQGRLMGLSRKLNEIIV